MSGPGQKKYYHQLSVFISRIAEVCEVKKLMEKKTQLGDPRCRNQHTLPALKNADYVGRTSG